MSESLVIWDKNNFFYFSLTYFSSLRRNRGRWVEERSRAARFWMSSSHLRLHILTRNVRLHLGNTSKHRRLYSGTDRGCNWLSSQCWLFQKQNAQDPEKENFPELFLFGHPAVRWLPFLHPPPSGGSHARKHQQKARRIVEGEDHGCAPDYLVGAWGPQYLMPVLTLAI